MNARCSLFARRARDALVPLALLFLAAVGALCPHARPAAASDMQDIGTGSRHSCAVTKEGGVQCWGNNEYGQLGDGTTTQRNAPVDVCADDECAAPLGGVLRVELGFKHTCVLTVGGSVQCWGFNEYGQLGDGSTADSSTPVSVCLDQACTAVLDGVEDLTVRRNHGCAVVAGGLKCWGENDYGQLGDGTQTDRSYPVGVVGLSSGVVASGAGDEHTCALVDMVPPDDDYEIKCWGNNVRGQLGDGTNAQSNTPVDVCDTGAEAPCSSAESNILTGVAVIGGGGNGHTCALMDDSSVKCWGTNGNGELGDGNYPTNSSTPVDVCADASCTENLSGIADVAAAENQACARTTEETLKCWGHNAHGQLGDRTHVNRHTPVDVCGPGQGLPCGSYLTDVTAFMVGSLHTCALTHRVAEGKTEADAVRTPLCWGGNYDGQLGDGTNVSTWSPINVLVDSDGDSCPDAAELQTDEGTETDGGRRNPKNPWDYFNPTNDGQNRVDDILAVLNRYFSAGDPNADMHTEPLPEPAYHPKFDRTYIGPNDWNLGQGDGRILVDDILHAVKQYFHDCGSGVEKQAEMSLGATGNGVVCDDPDRPTKCVAPYTEGDEGSGLFQLTVDAGAVAPHGGFQAEVFFGGLTYQEDTCSDEVPWPDMFLCSAYPLSHDLARQFESRTGLFPPLPESDFAGTIVELDVHCPSEGQFSVALTAAPDRPDGAAYLDSLGSLVYLETPGMQSIDTDGDSVPDAEVHVADALLIDCEAPPATPTPTP